MAYVEATGTSRTYDTAYYQETLWDATLTEWDAIPSGTSNVSKSDWDITSPTYTTSFTTSQIYTEQ